MNRLSELSGPLSTHRDVYKRSTIFELRAFHQTTLFHARKVMGEPGPFPSHTIAKLLLT